MEEFSFKTNYIHLPHYYHLPGDDVTTTHGAEPFAPRTTEDPILNSERFHPNLYNFSDEICSTITIIIKAINFRQPTPCAGGEKGKEKLERNSTLIVRTE